MNFKKYFESYERKIHWHGPMRLAQFGGNFKDSSFRQMAEALEKMDESVADSFKELGGSTPTKSLEYLFELDGHKYVIYIDHERYKADGGHHLYDITFGDVRKETSDGVHMNDIEQMTGRFHAYSVVASVLKCLNDEALPKLFDFWKEDTIVIKFSGSEDHTKKDKEDKSPNKRMRFYNNLMPRLIDRGIFRDFDVEYRSGERGGEHYGMFIVHPKKGA
jgi:hypothetical protein